MVRNYEGSWRAPGDYRCLNLATVPDTYLLPNIDFAAKAMAKFASEQDTVMY
jgi:hypothetical protein